MRSDEPSHRAGTAAGDDPIVTILREHTELQVMAERFRQIADALERAEPSARADAQEALEVHRRFLVAVHERREGMLAGEVRPGADPKLRDALARCAIEHPLADRFESEAAACLAESPLSHRGVRILAASLRAEADRFVNHHRWETEMIYSGLRGALPNETIARLREAMRPLVGEAAAAQSRLMSWSSRANAASD